MMFLLRKYALKEYNLDPYYLRNISLYSGKVRATALID